MRTKPEEIKTLEDIEHCHALEYEVFVYDHEGEPYVRGLITGWVPNSDIVYVGGQAVSTVHFHLTTIPF